MHLRNRITAGFSALVHKKLKVANGLQTGCKGCKKSCKGCNIVRIPFLCYTKQGSGERVTTKEQKKGNLYHIRADLSTVDDVHLRWYFSYFLYYTTSAVICQQLMAYTLTVPLFHLTQERGYVKRLQFCHLCHLFATYLPPFKNTHQQAENPYFMRVYSVHVLRLPPLPPIFDGTCI